MSIFNLSSQNSDLDHKITAGLERLSQVFRTLLWEKAKEQGLSPIQIQLLIFIRYHSREKSTVSYLAGEFNVTKPTISDAVKVLEQKKLIKKIVEAGDTRSYTMLLTAAGKKVVAETENFAAPIKGILANMKLPGKLMLWERIMELIVQLNQLQVISVQRTCVNCKYYSRKDEVHYCGLLQQQLKTQDIQIDCPEFVTREARAAT